MQTTNLNPALSPNNALQRNGSANGASINVAHGADAGQFSAMLSSQLAQAPAAPPAAPQAPAAPAPKPEAAKPAQAEQPPQPDPASAPQANGQDKTASADGAKDADAKDGEDGADADQAAAQAPADPASAMLALLASLQPGAKQAAATPAGASQAFDNLSGNAGKGKRFDANQLSALQAAIKSSSKEGAGAAVAADGKAFGAATIKNPALAAAGAALGSDDKAAAPGADKTAAGDVPGKVSTAMLKADPSAALDAAALSLQQARAAAEQAAQNPAPVASALQAVQPAALDAAQAVAAADQLSAQVGTDAWENQLGQKVVYMVGSEEQTASLTLNPPDLGPMQVVLSVSNDQASVTFSSNQQEVRQALENALPRLREMMSESGIALGNASVNAGMPDGRQAQQQDGSSRGGRNLGRARGIAGVDSADGADAAPRVITRSMPLGESGMVDTFA
jgi:flagellar hook-length control protein FliK